MAAPATLPANFSGWDDAPPKTLPADFSGWDADEPTPPVSGGWKFADEPTPPVSGGWKFADEPAVKPQGPRGLLTPGNLDLAARPVLRNSDGSVSTEVSKSWNFDGKEVLLPTIVNGKRVSDDEAIQHYRTTGEHLGMFDTPENANAAA